MGGPPSLDHLPSGLLSGRAGLDPRIKNVSNLVEGDTELTAVRLAIQEEMVEERFDVVAEPERRRQEIRSRVLGEGSGGAWRH